VDLLVIDDIEELMVHCRRMIEAKAKRGDVVENLTQKVEADPILMARLGPEKPAAEAAAKVLQAELHDLTQVGTLVEYLRREYGPVIDALKQIPRIVWVVGDTIRARLFLEFVQKEFEFSPDSPNLQLVQLG
jgi:hypothetical protein